MEQKGRIVCFYLGKECRYGDDAPVEDQMDCKTCPAYIIWQDLSDQRDRHE